MPFEHRPTAATLTSQINFQDVLNSSTVPILVLDRAFCIRYFTPAIQTAFGLIAGDVGRPVADLRSLSADDTLLTDAQVAFQLLSPVHRDVEARDGRFFQRIITPHKTNTHVVEGVVVTFIETTHHRRAMDILNQTIERAELANEAKSRFLTLASHDLRQPLQSLTFVHEALARRATDESTGRLVERLADTTRSMVSTLNALLDINQIELGEVRVKETDFSVGDILDKLHGEFLPQASERGIDFRVAPSAAAIHSDPLLLEQMLRQLLSSTFKLIASDRVLLGCRRRNGLLSVEIQYLSLNAVAKDVEGMFFESTGERKSKQSLSLSIAQRLAKLLGYSIHFSAQSDRRGVIAFNIPLAAMEMPAEQRPAPDVPTEERGHITANILVVEERDDVRELLDISLRNKGYRTVAVSSDAEAFRVTAQGAIHPDALVLANDLSAGLTGIDLAERLSATLKRRIPTVILAADLASDENEKVGRFGFAHLRKPANSDDVGRTIQQLLAPEERPRPQVRVAPATGVDEPTSSPQRAVHGTVIVVDDDKNVREALQGLLEDEHLSVVMFSSSEEFLAAAPPDEGACLLLDAYLPGMSGLDLLHHLRAAGRRIPVIMVTGNSDVSTAVQAMKAGAWDFLTKPVGRSEIITAVTRTLEQSRDAHKLSSWRENASKHLQNLTRRQRQIMELVLAGRPSKNIAADLGISQRTVENHRAHIMKKTGAKSLPELARVALAASMGDGGDLLRPLEQRQLGHLQRERRQLDQRHADQRQADQRQTDQRQLDYRR